MKNIFKNKLNLSKFESYRLGLLQAILVLAYCTFASVFMFKGDEIFGKIDSFIGPLLFLVLFSTSALLCSLAVFGIPVVLFLENSKNLKKSVEIVAFTALWLFCILGLLMIGLAIL